MSCGINPYSGGRGLPQSLLADGKRVRINTGFRRWLHFWRVMSAPELTCFEQRSIALINTFGALPADAAGAMREALWFYRCGRETFCEASGERLLDWDEDWLCIWADFRLYAGIDLDRGQLHWWRFMALFESLPRESGIKRRIWLRSLDPAEIGDTRLREKYRRMKEAVALGPCGERPGRL